jgi:integrase
VSTYLPKNSAIFYYDFVIDGRRYYGSTKQKTRRAAEKVEDRLRSKIVANQGQPAKKPAITLDEAAGIRETYLTERGKWSKTEEYIIYAAVAALGESVLVADITQADLVSYFAKRAGKVAASSVNREIDSIRPIWRGVMKTHDIGEMPDWNGLKYRVTEKAHRELYFEEEDALFDKLRADYRGFTEFALKSGWRLSEVINLRWSDLNLAQGIAKTVIKGGDLIARPLTQELRVIIANQPKIGPFVFTYVCQKSRKAFVDCKGRKHRARLKGQRYPFSSNGWRRPWAKALEEAGIDAFRFHDLRHTRGTRILRATNNLAIAQKALAHKNIKTTLRYAKAADEDVRWGLEVSDSRNIPEVREHEAGDRQKSGKN